VPNPRGTAGPADHLGFMLPVDDTSFRIFTVGSDQAMFDGYAAVLKNRWDQFDADPVSVQRTPNDFETQSSQGPITLHSEERLVSGDRGIVLLRRMLRRQIDVVAQGGDPIGVAFAPGDVLRVVEAGAFITAAKQDVT
jgi:hypothetical protein